MYYSFLEKQLARKKPFHQKVLHFQYDVPLSQLRKVFEFWCAEIRQPLMTANDGADMGRTLPIHEAFLFSESSWTPDLTERKTFGVFDKTETYYLRIEIDSIENTHDSEEVCGNFFLFAEEKELTKVANKFVDGCGQLVIEGTADYFMLLED